MNHEISFGMGWASLYPEVKFSLISYVKYTYVFEKAILVLKRSQFHNH